MLEYLNSVVRKLKDKNFMFCDKDVVRFYADNIETETYVIISPSSLAGQKIIEQKCRL